MKDIVDNLKKHLLLHPKVSKSILNNSLIWKRSHYIFLSELIEEELCKSVFMTPKKKSEIGISISYSTLQRFFSTKTDEKFINDLRFIKTLDKLCIFLGYKNLNDFLTNESDNTAIIALKKEEKIIENETGLQSDYFFNLIKKYCHEEFEYLKKLPIIDIANLKKYTFENGPFFNRITQNYGNFSKLGYTLSQENNRSNFELYNFKSLTLEKEFVVISVKEFWNLYFINKHGKTRHICNFSNTQKYFLKKINTEWKIWDNYNPNYKEFSDNLNAFLNEKII